MKISFMAASEPAPRITHEDVATPVAWGESRRNDLPCEAPGAWEPHVCPSRSDRPVARAGVDPVAPAALHDLLVDQVGLGGPRPHITWPGAARPEPPDPTSCHGEANLQVRKPSISECR
jgi:hypothetical protein